jgi:salicylate hydroxylase
MLPHAGQGANQCIEDAAALAEVLRDRPLAEVADAFLDYDRARRKRASFVQRFSRRLGLEYDGRHTEIPDTARLADKGRVWGWIFGHDSAENARQVRAGGVGVPLPPGAPV